MKDWRSAPRNGKAAFLEHREAIQAKLESGYTFKAIYDQLVASESEPPRVS
ncbi:TraK family protein, partial [Pseudomonas savastanoi]